MITSDYKYFSPKRHNVESTIQKILSFLKKENMWVSVLFTSDKVIKKLNTDYRGKRKATDVLSFSQLEAESFGNSLMLGDIVISVDTARKNAILFKNTLRQEIEALLIHGLLHLIGYDHERSDEDYVLMKKMEKDIQTYISQDSSNGSLLLNRN